MSPPKEMQVYPRRFNDGLDYRKTNLVVCTVKERQRLLPKVRKKTSSLYRGVSHSKRSGKWRAAIEVDGRTINLGEYSTEEEAAHSYNAAARKHFGSIAYQNRIDHRAGNRRVAGKK